MAANGCTFQLPIASKRTLASDFAYTPSGAIERLKIGNRRWESAKFNSRLQITELALGTSPTDGSLWKVNYHYGELETDGTTVNTAKNNGNIAKQTISFSGLSAPYVQTYRYDALHRITEARETSGSSQNWKQTWNYDRFGNRTAFNQWTGTTALSFNDNQQRPTINAANNRFNDNQGYHYDYNGNLISDAENRSFVFNADNKQVEVEDSNNTAGFIGKYYYDGDGKRVRKSREMRLRYLSTTKWGN